MAVHFLGANIEQARLGPFVLAGGLVGLFACARILSGVLAPAWRRVAPGARAVGLFLPIAVCAVTAMVMGHPEIAVGVVFGTSVGAMTTVVGITALAEPIGPGPARWRRLWPFPLAALLIVFVAGFKGYFGWRDAVTLAVEGGVVWALWRDRTAPAVEGGRAAAFDAALSRDAPAHGRAPAEAWTGGVDLSEAAEAAEAAVGPGEAERDPVWLRAVEVGVAVVVLVLASWAATQGLLNVGGRLKSFSNSGLAASVVSLALVMPMTYGAWRRASGGKSWEPMTTQVGVVLLNLCVLLPVLIVVPYLAGVEGQVGDWVATWGGEALRYGPGIAKPLAFPVAFWRVDTVVLIIVTVLLLPVAAGKWSLGREEGMVLVAGYFFYLTAILFAAGRM